MSTVSTLGSHGPAVPGSLQQTLYLPHKTRRSLPRSVFVAGPQPPRMAELLGEAPWKLEQFLFIPCRALAVPSESSPFPWGGGRSRLVTLSLSLEPHMRMEAVAHGPGTVPTLISSSSCASRAGKAA